MKRLLTAAGLPVAIALAVAGCGSSHKSSTRGASSSSGGVNSAQSSAPASGAAATIATRSTSLGTILTGTSGRTVYLFEADKGGKSSCNGACAQTWPPVAAASAGSGVKAALLTTTTRSDGSKQAVYKGHPLYYFTGDTQPTDTRGEGLHTFGADWYEIGPSGRNVEKPGS
jgi:predicted lipoprotein with Yx(FWY)xxD motif